MEKKKEMPKWLYIANIKMTNKTEVETSTIDRKGLKGITYKKDGRLHTEVTYYPIEEITKK